MTERRIKAWWGTDDDEAVEDLGVEDLEVLLERLEALGVDRPFLVDLSDDDGNVLTIGVGAPVTVLAFMESSEDPPYMTSVTQDPLIEGTQWFDYAGAESEFGPDQLIPVEVGRSVVRAFASTGDRSGVDWGEV